MTTTDETTGVRITVTLTGQIETGLTPIEGIGRTGTLIVRTGGTLVYLGSGIALDAMGRVWEQANDEASFLQPSVPRRLSPGEPGSRAVGSATLGGDVPIGVRPVPRAGSTPELLVAAGPITWIVRDRAALARAVEIWRYAAQHRLSVFPAGRPGVGRARKR